MGVCLKPQYKQEEINSEPHISRSAYNRNSNTSREEDQIVKIQTSVRKLQSKKRLSDKYIDKIEQFKDLVSKKSIQGLEYCNEDPDKQRGDKLTKIYEDYPSLVIDSKDFESIRKQRYIFNPGRFPVSVSEGNFTYIGQWDLSFKRKGIGKMYLSNNDLVEGILDGNDDYIGNARIFFSSGNIYEGK